MNGMENLLIYITIALALISIGLFAWVFVLARRITKLTAGNNARSLESVIAENNRLIKKVEAQQTRDGASIMKLQKDFMKSIQKIGIVRFNPFKETGGSQSFAIALIDQHKNGVVISSLYSRDRLNVFAKPVENGSSAYQLSDEEQQAITEAR